MINTESDLKKYSKKIRQDSELFCEIIQACKQLLRKSPLAQESREYLDKRISKNNQNKFDLGFFPSDANLDELLSVVDEKTLIKLNLLFKSSSPANQNFSPFIYKGFFNHHNIIIPYKDQYGNIIALIGRSILSEDEQKKKNIHKYKYTKFVKSFHLFGLYQAKQAILKTNSVIIVEGQIDCMTCHGHGFYNVVALGGSAMSKFQFLNIKKLTNNIYLLLDSDAAGQKGSRKIIDKYGKLAKIKELHLPTEFKDVDEYLKKSNDISVLMNYKDELLITDLTP